MKMSAISHLCRFCGLILDDRTKFVIANSDVIIKFYRLLPTEVQADDNDLPKNCCKVCEPKICDLMIFYDEVIATDQNLRGLLNGLPTTAGGQISQPKKQVQLRRLSELVKYKNELKKSDEPMKANSVSVTEIYNKLKAKGGLTISKFVDSEEDEMSEDEQDDSDSDCESADPENTAFDLSSGSEWSENDKPGASKRKRNVVKNPQVISLEGMQPNFVCARCKGKHKSLEALRHHLETNNECKDTDILCGECKKVFKTRRVYSKHIRDVHEKKEPPVFRCSNCGDTFPRECELQNHRVQCTGVCNEDFSGILFKCKDCDITFKRRIDLVQHIENHTKQLLCETCGKSCKTKKAYSQHVREHLGLKPFHCTLCEKRFRTNTLLLAHQHVHTGVKSFVCETCGKAFAKRASLVYHVRLHTGETPYVCDIWTCRERFTTSERLKNHLRKHRQNFYVE